MTLEERVAQLEFQVNLLFSGSELDRFVYETKITHDEYRSIMDIMDCIRKRLELGEQVSHNEYETAVYQKVPNMKYNYHFCETIARLFAEEGRWEEVFFALYGDMPKYGGSL